MSEAHPRLKPCGHAVYSYCGCSTDEPAEGVASPRQGERWAWRIVKTGRGLGLFRGNDTELVVALVPEDAEALCRALASHLGCEVGPKGWKATVYESRTDRYPEDGEPRKMFKDEGGVWGTYGFAAEFATADKCARAVEALSRDQAEGEHPASVQPEEKR